MFISLTSLADSTKKLAEGNYSPFWTQYHIGNNGSDTFSGADNRDDYMAGYGGNDTFHSSLGSNTYNGGAGHDTVNYSRSSGSVVVDLMAGRGYGSSDSSGDSYLWIEEIIGSRNGDTLIGNNASNTFRGGGGNDTLTGNGGINRLFGGANDDTFIGGNGRDLMFGGTGSDKVNYSGMASAVNVNFQTGRGSDGAQGDFYHSVETAIGSRFEDTFTGRDGVGNTFFGRNGSDTFNSSTGNNHYDGGHGFDTVSYEFSATSVNVNLLTGQARGGDANGDTYSSIDQIKGSQYGDELTGDDTTNYLYGGDGDDELFGNGGFDVIVGGEGADEINGGDGIDMAGYWDSAEGVEVNLSSGRGYGGDAQGDRLESIEWLYGSGSDDILIGDGNNNNLNGGSSGNDELYGRGGNDELSGQSGENILVGGEGDDLLFGGSGADDFIFEYGDGNDIIQYFSGVAGGEGDEIDLEDYGINDWNDLTNGGSRGMREINNGQDTQIYNNNGDSIILENVAMSSLVEDDFIF